MSGLLYPGVLGGLLTWLAPILAGYLTYWWRRGSCLLAPDCAAEPSPGMGLAVFVAMWFLIYHAACFAHLLMRHGEWASAAKASDTAKPYSRYSGLSDLIDCGAVLIVLGALMSLDGASLTAGSNAQFALVFVAVGLIYVSVEITHQMGASGMRLVLTVLTVLIGLFGIFANAVVRLRPYALNVGSFGLLYVMLLVYLLKVWPEKPAATEVAAPTH